MTDASTFSCPKSKGTLCHRLYPKYARRSFIIVGGARGRTNECGHVASLTPDLALQRLPLRVRPCPHASLPALVRSCDRQPTREVRNVLDDEQDTEERQKGEGSRAMSVVRETGIWLDQLPSPPGD